MKTNSTIQIAMGFSLLIQGLLCLKPPLATAVNNCPDGKDYPNYPYCPSPHITDITFDMSTLREEAPGSDNWPITWSTDGKGNDVQFTSWGDGGGFGGTNNDGRVSTGFARVEGNKDNYVGINTLGGKNPESGKNPSFTGKPYGIISIGGTIYIWRGGSGSNSGAFLEQVLHKSTDYCWSFQTVGVRFAPEDFPGNNGFFDPTFLQFGRDYEGARDNYVYTYAPEIKNNNWEVQKPGEITLMRVLIQDIEDKTKYEFFTGLDANNNPKPWSTLPVDREPVFKDEDNGVMRTSVSYNKGLDRYFLITQTVSRQRANNAHIGIYDAPEPWGPWTTVLFVHPWDIGLQNGSKTVFWNFSNKWLSADGKHFVLVYTGAGADSWGTVEGDFVTGGPPDTVPPSAPKNLRLKN